MLEPLPNTSDCDVQLPQKELTEQQMEAALLLAQGTTIVSAAATLEVSERTINRWKHIPEFKEAIRLARGELYEEALDLMESYMVKAVLTLVKCMDSKADYVKLNSSAEFIKLGLELHSMADLEAKVQQLEERMVDRKKDVRAWAI